MVFQCTKCETTFEQDGLALTMHDRCILHICPACLVNANTISVTISRKAPGRPFEFALLSTNEEPVYEVNNET